MANPSQLRLLLWKNWLILKRKWIVTSAQIILPCLFMFILMGIRTIVRSDKYSNITTWPSCDISKSPFTNNKSIDIGYTPNNRFTALIMRNFEKEYSFVTKGFDNEKNMVDYSLSTGVPVNYIGGIAFNSTSNSSATNWTINIRMRARAQNRTSNKLSTGKTWLTDLMFPIFQLQGPRVKEYPCGAKPDYYQQGFLFLQYGITKSLVEYINPQGKDFFNRTEFYIQRHPYPPFNDDKMVTVLQNQFPFILVLSYEFIAINIVKDIVEEKEKRLKEAMMMMGLSNWVHWLAWFIKYICFTFVTCCFMTLILCVPTGTMGSVINFTDPVVLLTFFFIFSLATISFCFMLSTFFSKANSGAAAAGVIFFVTYMPYTFISPRYDRLGIKAKIGTCIIANVALCYGGQILGRLEGQAVGLQWHNIGKGSSIDDPFAMWHILLMLLFDTFFYALVMWYVERVFPGEHSIPLCWYFPFTKAYWCGTIPEQYSNDIQPGVGQDSDFFEKEPINLKPGIQISCMRKEFARAKKVAVAGITLNMYEGQITALLGHNGAGKTTTISMITGFIPPTSGTAYVNGFDICKDLKSVRSSLGICPQYDVLFDKLNVEEHLEFFALLKGFPKEQVKEECEKMVDSIGLRAKLKNLSGELSGGMKRKLSLGMALIGGSKIVVLDEPSSGLDPAARHQVWSVIQNHRAGRTMLLTTHFMDEADCLGDRIAIMTEGVLRCCGSTLFLKSKYGAGYHLVLVVEPLCNVPSITNYLQSHIPQATMETKVGSELTYLLPHDSSSKFEDLFRLIEQDQIELGISSYGVTVTTMEEVFLKVSENILGEKIEPTESVQASPEPNTAEQRGSDFGRRKSRHLSLHSISPMALHRSYLNTGLNLVMQQFAVLLWKKALYTWRNKFLTIGQVLVPVFFTILSVIIVKTFPPEKVFPPLVLEPMAYGKNNIPYSTPLNMSAETQKISQYYLLELKHPELIVENVNKIPGFQKTPNMLKFLGKMGTDDLSHYIEFYQVAADFGYLVKRRMTSFFNAQSYHSSAISVSLMMSAVLKHFNGSESSVTFVNHPLPKSNSEKVDDQARGSSTAFTVSIILVFGISFLAGSFTIPLINERSLKAKHLQYLSGVHSFIYWLATYVWDMPIALIPCLLILAVFSGADLEEYGGAENAANLFILFLLYCLSILPMSYLGSFVFSIPSSGLVWLTLYNIIAGVASMMIVTILAFPTVGLEEEAKQITWIFMAFFPQFCLGQGLLDYASNYAAKAACKEVIPFCDMIPKNFSLIQCCKDKCGDKCLPINDNYLGWKPYGIGRMLFFMTIQSIGYSLIILIIESTTLRRVRYHLKHLFVKNIIGGVDNHAMDERHHMIDADVEKEQIRVRDTPLQSLVETDLVIMEDVVKKYGHFVAVNSLGVGIARGECFGLLGINGAGKTTTFKMLTGDEMITSGHLHIQGMNVKNNMRKVQREIGYCPQFDALMDSLTAREVLTMFAHFRGVHLRHIKDTVNELLERLMLQKYADKIVSTYSGGNKRKLSTAVALVGNPPVVLLDEPTTGMDPGTRRKLWNTLINIRDGGRTLILTSHSMDECEALCTRIAIMVNGQFQCLGSPQHLKSRFGEGYTLVAKMHYDEELSAPHDTGPFIQYIKEKFPDSQLKDSHEGVVHYEIKKDPSVSWSDLFGTLEKVKEMYHLETYSLGQTSLEQVFINFSLSQRRTTEKEIKGWRRFYRPCK